MAVQPSNTIIRVADRFIHGHACSSHTVQREKTQSESIHSISLTGQIIVIVIMILGGEMVVASLSKVSL